MLAEITETEQRAAELRVRSEPLTYREDVRESFFRDYAVVQLRKTDPTAAAARTRLERHQREMDVELRTNPRTALGLGGEFTPPLWAIDKFATAARAGRVISDLVPNMYLPAGVSSINIPVESTSASATIQADQGTAASTVDQVTANTSGSTIATIAGNVDASQQLFDRAPDPGYDAIVLVDLTRSYHANLEKQLTFGTGINGQLTGVTQVSGRQSDVSGGSTSVVQATGVATLKPLIGQAMAAVGNNRLLPVDNLVLAPRRWAWIVSDVSEVPQTQSWPLPGFPSVGADQSVTTLPMAFSGLPAYQSAACMSGAITATDVAVVFRSSDMLLYESDPYFIAMENPLSGTMRVRLQLHRYVAFPILRPAGICCVTALPAPTAFGA